MVLIIRLSYLWIKSTIAFGIVTLYSPCVGKIERNYLNYKYPLTQNFYILEMYVVCASK